MGEYYVNGQLFHHGIKGQKWGKRRFQNQDGSLTPAGEARYYDGDVKSARAAVKDAKKAYNKSFNAAYNKNYQSYSLSKKRRQASNERWEKAYDDANALNEAKANLKLAKNQRKVENKYKSAGDLAGRADYYKKKGDEASKKYDDSAKAFDKSSKRLEKEGKYVQAEAARRISQALKNKSSAARAQYDKTANDYLEASNARLQRADKYATKKNVDLGKKRVDSIVSQAKQKGYESETLLAEMNNKNDADD